MYDEILEHRKQNYRTTSSDSYIKHREEIMLNLRKNEIQNILKNKRMINLKPNLEINPDLLNVDISMPIEENDYNAFINMMRMTDTNYLKFGIHLLKIYSTRLEKAEDANEVMHTGLFDLYASILIQTEEYSIIFEIIWTIINLTYLTADDIYTKRLVDDDYISLFGKYLDIDIVDLKEETIWVLNNIIANKNNKAVFLKTNLLDKIFNISYKGAKISLTRNLSCFFKTISEDPDELDTNILDKIFEIFSNYIYLNDREIVSDCLWGLSNISDSKIDMNRYIKLIDRLLSIDYMNTNKEDINAILIILGNIIHSADNNVMQLLYEKDIIEYLEAVLMNIKSHKGRGRVLWVVSNLCVSGNFMVEHFLNSNLCNQVVKLIDNSNGYVKKEALWVFNNITAGRHFSHSLTLINKGLFNELMSIMNEIVDKEILMKVLYILENIFYTGEIINQISGKNPLIKKFVDIGGYDCLERLVSHYSIEVYGMADTMLKTYFKN